MLLSLCLTWYYVLSVYQSNSAHITLCNESTGLTIILGHPPDHIIVLSSARTKDALTCMGKGIPFYIRRIDYLSGSKLDYNEIRKRYSIDTNEDISLPEYTLSLNNTVLKTPLNRDHQSIFHLVLPSSPFIFLSDDYREGDMVYIAEKSIEFETLARKILGSKGAALNVLRRGEITRVR